MILVTEIKFASSWWDIELLSPERNCHRR